MNYFYLVLEKLKYFLGPIPKMGIDPKELDVQIRARLPVRQIEMKILYR